MGPINCCWVSQSELPNKESTKNIMEAERRGAEHQQRIFWPFPILEMSPSQLLLAFLKICQAIFAPFGFLYYVLQYYYVLRSC